MPPAILRLFRPSGPDRVAVVSIEPSAKGEFLIRLGRGPRMSRLTQGTTYGPYQEAELDAPYQQLLDSLLGEGFLRSGLHALLTDLQSSDPKVRARTAMRLGWRRDIEAVEPLLAVLPSAVDDACSILDALGMIGDTRAIPALREYAGRKLLSRRRSAVEALRNLDDDEGLEEANQRAMERLPDTVRRTLDASSDELTQSVMTLTPQNLGLALDTLYELATPNSISATRQVLSQIRFDQPNVWRYVKSVLKRTVLRNDFRTFGEVANAIEAQGRGSTGTTATVKSGYDGVERTTNIFRQKTQHYLRRFAWRCLRRLAFHRPEIYPFAAAEAVIPYNPTDAVPARELYGPYSGCYVLQRILYGNSQRLILDGRRMLFRFANSRALRPPTNVREEAYPELWDAVPRAYLRVLGAARLPEAHVFAVRALSTPRMKEAVLMTADHEEIIALLRAPYEPTVELGLEELDRRFDPQRPDWPLLALVLADDRRIVVERARRWVTATADLWTRDPDRTMLFLGAAHSSLRPLVIELAADRLPKLEEVRQQLALRMMQLFRKPEPQPGAHEGYAQLTRLVLLDELDRLLSLDDVLNLIEGPSPSAQTIGGELLGRRPTAIEELGLHRLAALAQHEIAAIRGAAHKLLLGAIDSLRRDPGPLFVLVESEWADTRQVAFEILRDKIGFETLGLDGLIGLIDSARVDVQALGRELVRLHLAELPLDVVIARLIEHPHPSMRPFTLDLVLQHLPPGPAPLEQVQGFCRSALFDLWPDRRVKQRVIDLLRQRGLIDEQQAAVAARLLSELVRVKATADFERAMEALVRIKVAYPELTTAIRLREEGLT